jgi:predicted nucleic acid-binding protein
MERLTYILDTNVIADSINGYAPVFQRLNTTVQANHTVCLCPPVYYEVLRGLCKVNATRKQTLFEKTIVPLLTWAPLLGEDWRQAARFWADAAKAGKQLADSDLLIAALAHRIGARIATADADFEVLSVHCENWRTRSPEA